MSSERGFSDAVTNPGGKDLTGLQDRSFLVVVSASYTPRTGRKCRPAYGKRFLDLER